MAVLVLAAGVFPFTASAPAQAAELPTPVNTGVDGFIAILYTPPAHSRPQAWQIAHHGYLPLTQPKVFCTDLATGQPCADNNGKATAWPKPLNTVHAPLGVGDTGDVSTTREPTFVSVGPRLYYPAVTTTPMQGYPSGSVGVGCLDLQTQHNCAYSPLQGLTNTPGIPNVNGLTGFVQSGSNLYGVSTNGQVLCASLPSLNPCPGQPYSANIPPNPNASAPGKGPNDYFGNMDAINGKVYITSTDPTQLNCFDPDTDGPCTGWQTPKPLGNSSSVLASAVYPGYDSNGTPIEVCTTTDGTDPATAVVVDCFTPEGAHITPPPGLGTLYPQGHTIAVTMKPETFAVNGDLRSYFPFSTSDHAYTGQTLCYDWTSHAACTGFPNPDPHPTVNGGQTYDYGYTFDGTCLFGLGDSGWLFSLDPNTGTTPC